MGRRDISNYDHVEEYRVSCVDMMSPLFIVSKSLLISFIKSLNIKCFEKLHCAISPEMTCINNEVHISNFHHDI